MEDCRDVADVRFRLDGGCRVRIGTGQEGIVYAAEVEWKSTKDTVEAAPQEYRAQRKKPEK